MHADAAHAFGNPPQGEVLRRTLCLAFVIAASAAAAVTLHDRFDGVSAVMTAQAATASVPPPQSPPFPATEAQAARRAAGELARPRECRLEQNIDTDCIFN